FGTTLKHVNIANGDNFPDGLCGGSLSALKGGPLLLVNDTAAIFNKATEYVKSVKAFQLTVYGGEGSVAEKTAKTIISMN
ncbi:MAG: cell wall-binding repeat-containing protein, partial [Firmicutes bacterium]|nr:cell wall-binding repeat-containing protein [Bacillota bacterium]